jgi:hypothetical protein
MCHGLPFCTIDYSILASVCLFLLISRARGDQYIQMEQSQTPGVQQSYIAPTTRALNDTSLLRYHDLSVPMLSHEGTGTSQFHLTWVRSTNLGCSINI